MEDEKIKYPLKRGRWESEGDTLMPLDFSHKPAILIEK